MKNRIKNIIALAFFAAIVFVSVGSKGHIYECESALPKTNENLSVIEFEKQAESIIEPKLNVFITGGSLKALLQ